MSFYLSATFVYPITSEPLKNGVLVLSADGTILETLTEEEAQARNINHIEYYDGLLVPGLINTHCHLELSHLAAKIPMHTGLPGFVQKVMQQRTADANEIEAAMVKADADMYANGIAAVGDISNLSLSRTVKLNSKIYYYTFVEAMGFNPGRAKEIMMKARETKATLAPLKVTIVPHAPYSVSEVLFAEINSVSGSPGESLTIHNQETADENAFFENKSGHFLELYKFLGLDISFFASSGKTSLQHYLPLLSAQPRLLLVHNTFTSKEDVEFAGRYRHNLFWCLCPNANLYIEDRLPDVNLLREAGCKITLGTDSLASNHQLSILEEMRVLQERTTVPFEELLLWATLNGAEFLGISGQFGSFQAGKKPGVNLIEFTAGDQINEHSRIRRLF